MRRLVGGASHCLAVEIAGADHPGRTFAVSAWYSLAPFDVEFSSLYPQGFNGTRPCPFGILAGGINADALPREPARRGAGRGRGSGCNVPPAAAGRGRARLTVPAGELVINEVWPDSQFYIRRKVSWYHVYPSMRAVNRSSASPARGW